MIIYEGGARNPNGSYSSFIESNDKTKVEDYLIIMDKCVPLEFELVLLEKFYTLTCTTPSIVRRKHD